MNKEKTQIEFPYKIRVKNKQGQEWRWLFDPIKGDYFSWENDKIRAKLVSDEVKIKKVYCSSEEFMKKFNIIGGGGGDTEVTSHTYYYYKVKAAHNSIDASQPIYCYDAFGALVYTIPPYDSNANYGAGVYSVPGTEKNSTIESVSTATYWVFYSSGDLVIDYDNVEFKIAKHLIRAPAQTTVKATFEYLSVITPFRDVASVIDGKWDTQVQTEFFGEPPPGYNYAILDLGAVYEVQALDIIAGFYKPDEYRKYDVDFTISIQYSLDGIDYYDVGDKGDNMKFGGGESMSLEESDLGMGFRARFFKVLLQNVKRLEYKDGVWVVAFTEIAAYNDIVMTSEATLIPTTYLSQLINLSGLSSAEYPDTIYVESTAGFESSGTAYILNADGLTFDSFTYTGLTATTFTGIEGLTSSHAKEAMVVQNQSDDSSLYDYDGLLPKLKDRIYKKNMVDDNTLYTQSQLDYVAKSFLREFYKNHSKIQVNVLYSPHIQVGQTIHVVDTYNNIDANYFVESITDANGNFTIVLAKFPA